MATAPANWYDDPERPGHMRWWTGVEWGMRDIEFPQPAPTTPPPSIPSTPAAVLAGRPAALPASFFQAPAPRQPSATQGPEPDYESVPARRAPRRAEPSDYYDEDDDFEPTLWESFTSEGFSGMVKQAKYFGIAILAAVVVLGAVLLVFNPFKSHSSSTTSQATSVPHVSAGSFCANVAAIGSQLSPNGSGQTLTRASFLSSVSESISNDEKALGYLQSAIASAPSPPLAQALHAEMSHLAAILSDAKQMQALVEAMPASATGTQVASATLTLEKQSLASLITMPTASSSVQAELKSACPNAG